jgi:hypothetical protein
MLTRLALAAIVSVIHISPAASAWWVIQDGTKNQCRLRWTARPDQPPQENSSAARRGVGCVLKTSWRYVPMIQTIRGSTASQLSPAVFAIETPRADSSRLSKGRSCRLGLAMVQKQGGPFGGVCASARNAIVRAEVIKMPVRAMPSQ